MNGTDKLLDLTYVPVPEEEHIEHNGTKELLGDHESVNEQIPILNMKSFDEKPNLTYLPIPEEADLEPGETEKLLGDQDSLEVNLATGNYQTIDHTAESGDILSSLARTTKPKSPQRKRTSIFWNFRSASLSVSLLAKPSDDRYASSVLAGWNVSNLIQGTGILGVPYAVAQGGWAAVASIFVVAAVCCYTGKLLISCLYETSKKTNIKRRVRVNYPEVGEAVFKKRGHTIVALVQICEMFGGVIMYVVLLGAVLGDLLKASTHLGPSEWAAISCVIVLPALAIRRMSIISWLSMISVFALMSSIVTLIVFSFTTLHEWKLKNIPPFNPKTFPVGFGIIVFSYTAHAVFPSIESSMRKPEQFNAMMNWSFLLAAVVKTLLGTCMVLAFGEKTQEVATVNLKESKGFSITAAALVITNVVLAVPLNMFVVSMTFDDGLLKFFPHLNTDSKYHWIWLVMTRPLLLCAALFLSLVIPHFGLLLGFVGSFTGTCLCFIFPCWFHLKLRWNRLGKLQIALNIFIMIFGALAGFLGVYFSGKALIQTFRFSR